MVHDRPDQWVSVPIAQCRFDPDSTEWPLYCCNRNGSALWSARFTSWIVALSSISEHADRLAKAIAGGEPIDLPGVVLTQILLRWKSEVEAQRISDLLLAFDVDSASTLGRCT
ncbi:hypothetical protein [Aromatoleum sp.]|uniref:hypothetical protein n=1 Tax=Aromatoleum sp. TaxID=2307007 RepID=UPI003FA55491